MTTHEEHLFKNKTILWQKQNSLWQKIADRGNMWLMNVWLRVLRFCTQVRNIRHKIGLAANKDET